MVQHSPWSKSPRGRGVFSAWGAFPELCIHMPEETQDGETEAQSKYGM